MNRSEKKGGSSGGGRGFAGMDEEKQREIARKGGQVAHERGKAHEFDSAEAREAGRKGGEAVSRDRGHMAEIGARGGHASHGGASKGREQPQSRPSSSERGREDAGQPEGRRADRSRAAKDQDND